MPLLCTSKEIKVTKPETTTTRLAYFREQWYKKWNRVGAVIMGVLGFSLMIAIVMDSAWRAGQLAQGNDMGQLGNANALAPFCRVKNATISCSKLRPRNNMDGIFRKCQPNIAPNKVSLEVTSIKKPALCLREKWMMSTNFSIHTLMLRNIFILCIATNAFSGILFEKLEEINLIQSHVLHIENSAFCMPTLQSLSFVGISVGIIERQFSSGFYRSILRFEFMNISSLQAPSEELFRNLTGHAKPEFPRVSHVDFSRNSIGKLDASMFSAVVNVEVINLEYSQIFYIEIGTFSEMDNLKVLKLNGNKLKMFLDVIFQNCQFLIPNECRLFLNDNNWITNSNFYSNPYGIMAKDLVLFGATSKTCKIFSDSFISCLSYPLVTDDILFVNFTLTQVDIDGVMIKIGHYQEKLRYKLTVMTNDRKWMKLVEKIENKSLNESPFRCIDSFENFTLIENLYLDIPYTICVMGTNDSVVSPLSCQSITLNSSGHPRPWIHQKFTYILLTAVLIFVFVVGLLIGLFSNRINPKKLATNKKVVLINHKSSISNSEDQEEIYGHIYCTIRTPKLSRSLSDSVGLYSKSPEDNSYIVPREFSGPGKITDRLSSSMIVYPSEPPPLPPHPLHDKV